MNYPQYPLLSGALRVYFLRTKIVPMAANSFWVDSSWPKLDCRNVCIFTYHSDLSTCHSLPLFEQWMCMVTFKECSSNITNKNQFIYADMQQTDFFNEAWGITVWNLHVWFSAIFIYSETALVHVTNYKNSIHVLLKRWVASSKKLWNKPANTYPSVSNGKLMVMPYICIKLCCLSNFTIITVELQWLELLWDHENLFETGVVRANEGWL